MTLFNHKADRTIAQAHNAIACAEMRVYHAFTDSDKREANCALAQAQDFLSRAIKAKEEWYSTEHDDYDEYPDVPEVTQ